MGKVWKKEDELKQLKSELATLYGGIQLELALPTPQVETKEEIDKVQTIGVPEPTVRHARGRHI